MLHVKLHTKPILVLCSFLGISVVLIPSDVSAVDGVGTIAAEATIYENEPENNGGLAPFVCIGNLSSNAATRRAFMRWNLPAIPPGSIITRVQLLVNQVQVRNMGGRLAATLELRRANTAWTEGNGQGAGDGACSGGSNVVGVDWNSAPAVNATLSAEEALPDEDDVLITMDTDIGTNDDVLLTDVQFWLDNPGLNFGWLLQVAEEITADNARRIAPQTFTVFWTEPADPDVVFSDGFETIL